MGILSCKFLLRQHDNGSLIVATMMTITTMKIYDKIKKGGIRYSNYTNVFKAQIRGISRIAIQKWIIVILIFQIMWLLSLNLAFKITSNLDIFFIVATIETIVLTIIAPKFYCLHDNVTTSPSLQNRRKSTLLSS